MCFAGRDETDIGSRVDQRHLCVWLCVEKGEVLQVTLAGLLYQISFFCAIANKHELNICPVTHLISRIKYSHQSMYDSVSASIKYSKPIIPPKPPTNLYGRLRDWAKQSCIDAIYTQEDTLRREPTLNEVVTYTFRDYPDDTRVLIS